MNSEQALDVHTTEGRREFGRLLMTFAKYWTIRDTKNEAGEELLTLSAEVDLALTRDDVAALMTGTVRAMTTDRLTEPTGEEVERAAEYLYGEVSGNRVAEWDDVRDGTTGENYRELACGALRAAGELS